MRQHLTKRRNDRKTHMNRNTDKNYGMCWQITSRVGLAPLCTTKSLVNISGMLIVSSPFTEQL